MFTTKEILRGFLVDSKAIRSPTFPPKIGIKVLKTTIIHLNNIDAALYNGQDCIRTLYNQREVVWGESNSRCRQ